MILKNRSVTLFISFAKGFGVCLFVILNFVVLLPVQSQDQSNFTQFYLNPYVLNSSYAGFDGQPSISLLYRKQWMTIEGAPTIVNLSLHAPVNARVSAGVNITNDSKGFFNNSTVLFSLGYHVQIEDHAFLRFGISAGGSWNTVDMEKLEGINDPALTDVLNNNASLAGNAGVSLHLKLFHFGIALPSIFSPSYVSQDAFSVKEVKPFQALVLHASNRFYFNNNKNIFEPYAVYRINTGLPSQYEFAGLVHLDHVVWVGGSYKQDFGFSALGGIKMKNMLAIGASYSIQKSGAEELNSPSFEVSLNYLFGQHKRGAPVYSFVNAVKQKERKPTTATRETVIARRQQAEAEQKRKAEAAARLKQEQLEEKNRLAEQSRIKQEEAQKKQLETQSRLKQEADEKKRLNEHGKLKQEEAAKARKSESEEEAKRLADQNRIEQQEMAREREERAKQEQEASARKKNQEEQEKLRAEEIRKKQSAEETLADQQEQLQPTTVPSADLPVEGHAQHEQEQLERLETHAENPNRPVEDTMKIARSVRHEFVKRGNHAEELEVSDYVIVGVFKSVGNAKLFSDGLRSLNFNAHYGHLTEKDIWYVYLFKTTNTERARAEQARVSKLFLLRDAWLLTVLP